MTNSQICEGQIVRILDGPLTGFRGEVKELNESAATAKVAVQVYGHLALINLALKYIERAP
jgi:transcription antitermination factor NusG